MLKIRKYISDFELNVSEINKKFYSTNILLIFFLIFLNFSHIKFSLFWVEDFNFWFNQFMIELILFIFISRNLDILLSRKKINKSFQNILSFILSLFISNSLIFIINSVKLSVYLMIYILISSIFTFLINRYAFDKGIQLGLQKYRLENLENDKKFNEIIDQMTTLDIERNIKLLKFGEENWSKIEFIKKKFENLDTLKSFLVDIEKVYETKVNLLNDNKENKK